MGSLSHLEQCFTRVGWFIPPYMQLGMLHEIATKIYAAGSQFTQDDLEEALGRLYQPCLLYTSRCV